MNSYHLLIGAYDHKLGPICVTPKKNCKWLNENITNPSALIQDGLNTKSKFFNIKYKDKLIQIYKFSIEDERLRGGLLRCAIFCFIPFEKYLFPEKILKTITDKYKEISSIHDKDLNHPECVDYIVDQESKLNEELIEEIGTGQIEHKRRDLLNSIIGFAQLLSEGTFGELNDEQKKNIDLISKNANDLLEVTFKPYDLIG